jgi:anti-sigma regulatory factor (Ser/Thr protein kinase)
VGRLGEVRSLVAGLVADQGCAPDVAEDFVLAVNEVATNSVRYGGGTGDLSAWVTAGDLVCEIHDRGRIDEPLIGRIRPELSSRGGYGLWLANQLCDLVQIRSHPDGSVIRLHLRVA